MRFNKRLMRRLRQFGIVLVITLIALELLLRFVDPVGIFTLYEDVRMLKVRQVSIPHPTRIYTYRPGPHQLYSYTLTINDNNERVAPDMGNGDCNIHFVGDSFTMGMGVQDNEPFPNRIAADYPDVAIHNNAIIGYNIAQVATVINETTADGYIYFIYVNDAELPAEIPTRLPRWMSSAIVMHIHHGYILPAEAAKVQQDYNMFNREYAALAARDDVLLLTFEDNPLPITDATITIPGRYDWISAVDIHPSASGHEQIASAIEPDVAAFIEARCAAG